MALAPHRALALALDPALLLEAAGLHADPWQRAFLLDNARQTLLNCSRQAGKSTVVSALALHTALFRPGSLVLLVSKSQRQSHELFRKVLQLYNAAGRPVPTVQDNQTLSRLELANGSRVVGLPGNEATIRSFSSVALLILDEAARIADDLYGSVRPMLAASQGRLVALSTPFGQRGWFYREWHHNEAFRKVLVPWDQCPRISAGFVAQEEESLGKAWVDQEYRCLFTATEGLVYPDFASCVWDAAGVAKGRLVGGIDFGWRNPFAAVWGALDDNDILTIVEERYKRETPLHEHARVLKRLPPTMWYADPAGATEIAELRAAGLKVLRGDNDIRHGIAAVTARIRTGRLRINRSTCPNLIAEAGLYRYPDARERANLGENPIDSDNHALAALRYLVSKIDARFIAKLRRRGSGAQPEEEVQPIAANDAEAHRERWLETRRAVYGLDDPPLGDDSWTIL
jgi:hypothetical protein